MKLYLVIGRDDVDEMIDDNVFGVFDSMKKAMEIKENIDRNFLEHNEELRVEIIEMKLNECTEDYHYFMMN